MKRTYLLILALLSTFMSKTFSYEIIKHTKNIKEQSKIGVGDSTCSDYLE